MSVSALLGKVVPKKAPVASNKAESGAKIYKGFGFVLLRVGNVQVATNVLHIERSESLRDLLIFESVLAMFIIEFGLNDFNRIKACVVNRYFPCFQISDIKKPLPFDFCDGRNRSGLTW
jgi:hypothetical protein